MEQLRERIKALMSDNEAVKNNALKAITSKTGSEERCTAMFTKARIENQAYQNVLDEMDSIVAGRVAKESKGVQNG